MIDRRKKNIPIDFEDRRKEDRRKKNMNVENERRV
jgi:hypothetical protein|tara:strand:- start:673 stop:777 length:105 start_codon:yes stop_codon:yes gene_type:complete